MKHQVDYFSSESLRQDLKGKAVSGGRVMVAAQISRILVGLASIPLLTRLVEPEYHGLVRLVTIFTGFAAMFVDAGLSMATVQREEIDHRQVSNLFWIATSLGAIIACLMTAFAPVLSWVNDDNRLLAIALVLAVTFVTSGLTVQHQALLRRGMQFHRLAAVSLTSHVFGALAGIALAWAWRTQTYVYWALVMIPVATSLSRMLFTWLACPWRPGLPHRGAGTRQLIVFGANRAGFSSVNYLARNADSMLIGWWWGQQSLGFYEKAYSLLLFPMRQISPSLTSVVVPSLSRLRSSPEQYRSAYLAAVRTLVWATVPVVGLLFAISKPLVLIYLGPGWEPVVGMFRALIPAAWCSSFICCSGWVFISWGHVDRHLKWGIAHSLALVATMLACAPFGVLAIAYGVSAAYVLLRPIGFYICYYGTPIRVSDLARVLWRPSVATILAAGLGWYASEQALVGPTEISYSQLVSSLVISAAAFSTVFASLVAITPGAAKEIKRVWQLLQTKRAAPSTAPDDGG